MYTRATLRALTAGRVTSVALSEGLAARRPALGSDTIDVYSCGLLLARYADDRLVLHTSQGYPFLTADALNLLLPEHGLQATVGLNEATGADTVMLHDPGDPASEPWSIDNGEATLHYNELTPPLPPPYRHVGSLVTAEELCAHLLDAHGCRGPSHVGEMVLAGFHDDLHETCAPPTHPHDHR